MEKVFQGNTGLSRMLTSFPPWGKICIRKKHAVFVSLEKRADDWKTPNQRRKLSHDYYINKENLECFVTDDLGYRRNCLDKSLVESFGYFML